MFDLTTIQLMNLAKFAEHQNREVFGIPVASITISQASEAVQTCMNIFPNQGRDYVQLLDQASRKPRIPLIGVL